MGSKRKLTKFTKDFIPLGKDQNKTVYTLHPRITKRKILRRRDPSLNMLESINQLQDKIKYDTKSVDE